MSSEEAVVVQPKKRGRKPKIHPDFIAKLMELAQEELENSKTTEDQG